jgi:hypothetical protein
VEKITLSIHPSNSRSLIEAAVGTINAVGELITNPLKIVDTMMFSQGLAVPYLICVEIDSDLDSRYS